MGISSALYSGVSGLNTNANAMSVLGNNLANVNTVGFKGSRSVFSDLLSGSISGSGGRSQVGRGVNVSSVDQVFSQGTFDTTESNLDCAIEGEGFFIVSPPDEDNNYYTRAGAFHIDGEGFLVNAEGYVVQGKKFDKNGALLPGDAVNIQLENRGLVGGTISNEIALNTNLDSRSEIKKAVNFNPLDSTTYNYASSVEIFDSLGVAHAITLYFMRDSTDVVNGSSTWKVAWTANDVDGKPMGNVDANGNPTGNMLEEGWPPGRDDLPSTKELVFNSEGQLIDPDPNTDMQEKTCLTIPAAKLLWGNGSAVEDIRVTFDTTQYSSDSTVLSIDQNGYGAGGMTSVEIDDVGVLVANYSNGKQAKLYQLSLAKFANPNGLELMGSNIFSATPKSGAPRVGVPDEELGKVYTSSLEKSNVDMGSEMVQMITVQRGYSANSKIITSIDEMMQEVINLKR